MLTKLTTWLKLQLKGILLKIIALITFLEVITNLTQFKLVFFFNNVLLFTLAKEIILFNILVIGFASLKSNIMFSKSIHIDNFYSEFRNGKEYIYSYDRDIPLTQKEEQQRVLCRNYFIPIYIIIWVYFLIQPHSSDWIKMPFDLEKWWYNAAIPLIFVTLSPLLYRYFYNHRLGEIGQTIRRFALYGLKATGIYIVLISIYYFIYLKHYEIVTRFSEVWS